MCKSDQLAGCLRQPVFFYQLPQYPEALRYHIVVNDAEADAYKMGKPCVCTKNMPGSNADVLRYGGLVQLKCIDVFIQLYPQRIASLRPAYFGIGGKAGGDRF